MMATNIPLPFKINDKTKISQYLKSEMLCHNLQQLDRDHIKRVLMLEESSEYQYLSMDQALELVKMYYSMKDGVMRPVKDVSSATFKEEINIAHSKAIVTVNPQQESPSPAIALDHVPIIDILRAFKVNPRLSLVLEIMSGGVTEKLLRRLMSMFYPKLRSMNFNKLRCKKFILRIVERQKKKYSSKLNHANKDRYNEAVDATVTFMFRCFTDPVTLPSTTVIRFLYDNTAILDTISTAPKTTTSIANLSNRPTMTKRTECLKKYFTSLDFTAASHQMAQIKDNFILQFICNPPISGETLIKIIEHYKPDSKATIDASELKPFFSTLPEIQDANSRGAVSSKVFKKKMRICELILALPLEESLDEAFSLLFSPINGFFFMKLWKTYDFDQSGDLDPEEASGLIREMLHKSASNPTQTYSGRRKSLSTDFMRGVDNVCTVIVQVLFTCFQKENLTLTDLGHFLNIQQNYLNKYLLSAGLNTQNPDICNHYDTNKNGFVEGEEISALVRDIVVTVNGSEVDVVHDEVNLARSLIMCMWDEDKDGKIKSEEVFGMIPRRTACFTTKANKVRRPSTSSDEII